jgi:hypothetical protein
MSFEPGGQVFNTIYWLFNTPGIGGLAVVALIGGCLAVCGAALRWIAAGAAADDPATYAYPTSALFHHPDGAQGAQGGRTSWRSS